MPVAMLLILYVSSALAGRTVTTDPTLPLTGFHRELLKVGTDCAAGYFQARPGPTSTPAQGVVNWSDLNDLGWKVPAGGRPNSANYQSSGLLTAQDFFSVMCNGFGEVTANRQACDQNGPSQVRGATHVRYDCATGTIWFLTYAFTDITFNTGVSDMWMRTCTGVDDDCRGGGGGKFVQYDSTANTALGRAADGKCGGTCSTTCTSATTCPWCCNDVWGVVDGTGADQKWVGYMSKVDFTLPTDYTVTQDQVVVHWQSEGNTISSTTGFGTTVSPQGICFNCAGNEQPGDNPHWLSTPTATSSTVDVAVTRAPANPDTPGYCSVEGTPTGITSGTPVSVKCTKPSDESLADWPASFPVGLTATAGGADCPGSGTASADIIILPQPVVTVNGPAADSVCEDAASRTLVYTVTSTTPGAASPMTATIRVTDSEGAALPGVSCQSGGSDTVQVTSRESFTVTCQPAAVADGQWPIGSFKVVVDAVGAQTNLQTCIGTAAQTTTITVNKLPVITIPNPSWATAGTSGTSNPAVCSTDSQIVFDWTINTGSSGLPFAVATTSGVDGCAITTPAAGNTNAVPSSTASPNVVVTCQKEGGWSSAFNVNLQASSGKAGCGDAKELTVAVSRTALPTVALTGPATRDECAANSVSLNFQASAQAGGVGVPWIMSATANVAGVTCTTTTGTGAAAAKIVCSTASGILPAEFTATATITAGRVGCAAAPATATTTVRSSCCVSGSSYAMGSVAGNTFSSSACFSTGMNCQNTNWGWTNRLSGVGGPTAYPIIVGAGLGCKGRNQVGTVSIACTEANGNAVATLGPFNQRVVGTGIQNHIYMGCQANNACTPPDFYSPPKGGVKPSACTSGTPVSMCGGNAPVAMFAQQQPVTGVLSCSCKSVFWVLHQSYDKFIVERDEAGSCPARS